MKITEIRPSVFLKNRISAVKSVINPAAALKNALGKNTSCSPAYVTDLINDIIFSWCVRSCNKLFTSLKPEEKEFFPKIIQSCIEFGKKVEVSYVKAFQKLYKSGTEKYSAEELLTIFNYAKYKCKLPEKNWKFVLENLDDKNLIFYLSHFCFDKPEELEIKGAKRLLNAGFSEKGTSYLIRCIWQSYNIEDFCDKVVRLKQKGWKEKQIYKIANSRFEEEEFDSLKYIRDEAGKRSTILGYCEEEEEVEKELDDIFLSDANKTVNTINLLGENSLIYLFKDKIENIDFYIQTLGELDTSQKYYQELIRLTNPVKSSKYKENINQIKKLKKELSSCSEKETLIKKINTLTKENHTLINKSMKDPQDKLDVAMIYYTLEDSPQKLKYFMDMIKNGFDKEKLKKKWNKILPIDNKRHFNFAKTKYFPKLFQMDDECANNLINLMNILNRNLNMSVAQTLNNLPQNLKTKHIFFNNGIDYKSWIKYNPNSFIEKDIGICYSKQKANIIKNLEAEFNDNTYPEKEKLELANTLAKRGYNLKLVKEPVFDEIETLCGQKDRLKLFKGKDKIAFEDIIPIINILKSEMESDTYNNEPLKTLKSHILNQIYDGAKSALRTKNDKNIKLRVQKADMNNIEHALFLGNDASCCTAIGTGCNQWTAPNYIINKLISCIELKDGEKFVGNTMCFIAKIDDEPALILDNIELKSEYQYNDQIRDLIFEYANKLTSQIGKPDMHIFAGPNRHKVDMDKYPIVEKDFTILGSTGDTDILLDFDTDSHIISGKENFKSALYKIF